MAERGVFQADIDISPEDILTKQQAAEVVTSDDETIQTNHRSDLRIAEFKQRNG